MGLFSKPRATGEPADAMTPADAFAGIAMCAMYADGVMSAEEDDELAVYLARLRVFGGLGDREMRACFQKAHGIAATEGDGALLERSAAAVPERLRPTAFLVAADLVMTDGEFGDEERGFLRRVQERLGVDDALATKIFDVLAIKHAA